MPEPTTGEKSVGEVEFIEQMTRKMMVNWCDCVIRGIPLMNLFHEPTGAEIYAEHAKAKGWISKDGTRVLSEGWKTAARFLKR